MLSLLQEQSIFLPHSRAVEAYEYLDSAAMVVKNASRLLHLIGRRAHEWFAVFAV